MRGYNVAVRIYTKTGDGGETGLFGGGRVPKDHPRIEAFGAVDELNALIGTARAAGLEALDALAGRIQDGLFRLGADLATPADGSARAGTIVRIAEEETAALEGEIDRLDESLPPLQTFILPGGSAAAAQLHLARTVCRRAERNVVALVREGDASSVALRYLNRLSDLLFVMARAANVQAGCEEHPWKP